MPSFCNLLKGRRRVSACGISLRSHGGGVAGRVGFRFGQQHFCKRFSLSSLCLSDRRYLLLYCLNAPFLRGFCSLPPTTTEVRSLTSSSSAWWPGGRFARFLSVRSKSRLFRVLFVQFDAICIFGMQPFRNDLPRVRVLLLKIYITNRLRGIWSEYSAGADCLTM